MHWSHLLTSLYKSKDDKRRIFDSIIVVTDRTNLDDQLRGTVKSLSKVDGVVFGAEKGSKELREFLEKSKDIIITTIQKFPYISEDIVALGDKKFAVIIDEVHSSQNGELSKELKKRLWSNLFQNSGAEFIEAKLKERQIRHAKNGEARYVVEPNVKEGKETKNVSIVQWQLKVAFCMSQWVVELLL